MKKLFIILGLAIATPLFQSGCQSAPTQRVVAVQTLSAVGISAKAGINTVTSLLKQHKISVVDYQKVADFYDNKFQPAYGLAVVSVQSDLSSIASPDLLALAAQFAALVAQVTQ